MRTECTRSFIDKHNSQVNQPGMLLQVSRLTQVQCTLQDELAFLYASILHYLNRCFLGVFFCFSQSNNTSDTSPWYGIYFDI